MERPIYKPIGSSVEELDTPALVVDVETMESNLEVLHSFFRTRPAKVRPHIKVHKSPVIAHQQLAMGGTVGGICTATVGEAEAFADGGLTDILVANEIVTKPKIDRLCSLAHKTKVSTAVDNVGNIKDLSEAAQAHGVLLHILVDINTRLNRCGVEPGRPALELAQMVAKSDGLVFEGLMTYEGNIRTENYDDLVAESKKWIQMVLDTRETIEKAGLEVNVVSVGATHNYEIAGAISGVTEVQAGTYVFMDALNLPLRSQFRSALKILATIMSCPTDDLAIADAGHKASGPDHGLPVVDGVAEAKVTRISAEHSRITLGENSPRNQLTLGSKVRLTPWHLELCTNQYNYLHAIRGGKLEAVWEMTSRGRFS